MENFFWRTRARLAAQVDLVSWVIMLMVESLKYALAFTIGLDLALKKANLDKDALEQLNASDFWWTWAWIYIALFALFTGLQLWASLKLLRATELGRDVNEAFKGARFWWNVTSSFCAIYVVGVATGVAMDISLNGFAGWFATFAYGWFWTILESCFFIWRVNVLFFVYKYMEELEGTSDPAGVAGPIVPDRIIIVK